MYEREIADEVRELSPEKQREVLDFAAFLKQRSPHSQRKSMLGALKHLNLDITEDDIREVRREAWKNFPRDLQD